MTDLYVGNATNKLLVLCYRFLGEDNVREVEVPPGTQARIPDLSPDQVAQVVRQSPALRGAAEVGFSGLCYSAGAPIGGVPTASRALRCAGA